MVVKWEDKNNYKLENDLGAIEYIRRMGKFENEIQQCNQYDYSRFDNGCVVASSLSIICSHFNIDPDTRLLRKFDKEAERRGRDLGRDGIPVKYLDDAAKMVVSYWNSIYPDKKSLFLEDDMYSDSWYICAEAGLPIQYRVKTTQEWRDQKKTGRVTNPIGKIKSNHALFGVYDPIQKEMTFYDSNEGRAGDVFKVSQDVLNIMEHKYISPVCRVYLPYNKIHAIDEKTYKALQMYKNINREMSKRIDDEDFNNAIEALNLSIDNLLGEQ